MKRYKKDNEIKFSKDITIRKNGMVTYNPTEEMLIEDGWEEYVPPTYEPTEEELLTRAKQDKKKEIERFDTSQEVNEFSVQGFPIWLDKATRAGLMLRFQAEQAMGKEDTVLWYNGMQFPLALENALAMLYTIENYASACYDNTQRHLAVVDNLTTVDEVELYDYRAGYPEKLEF